MKIDIVIADPLCEKGHIPTTKFFLNELKENFNVCFIANLEYANMIGAKAFSTLNIINPKPYKGIKWIAANIYILFKISYTAKRNFPNTQIVLLSYETISFMICRLFFFNLKNAYIFNHNNIDQLEHSLIKRLAFRALSVPTKHLVYEPYIQKFIESNSYFKYKAMVVSHPYIYSWRPQSIGKKINIFIPHIIDDKKLNIINIITKKNDEFSIRAKSFKQIKSLNLYTKTYFEDFHEELIKANILIIFKLFKYRSSGVAYAAISSGCILVIKKSLFSIQLKLKYPNQVFLFTSSESLLILLNKINNNRKNFFNYKKINSKPSYISDVLLK